MFHQIWKILVIFFLQTIYLTLSLFPSETPIVYIMVQSVFHGSLGCVYFSLFFFLLRLNNFNSPVFMFADSFFNMLNSAVEPLVNFSIYCIFQIQNLGFVCLFVLLICFVTQFLFLC